MLPRSVFFLSLTLALLSAEGLRIGVVSPHKRCQALCGRFQDSIEGNRPLGAESVVFQPALRPLRAMLSPDKATGGQDVTATSDSCSRRALLTFLAIFMWLPAASAQGPRSAGAPALRMEATSPETAYDMVILMRCARSFGLLFTFRLLVPCLQQYALFRVCDNRRDGTAGLLAKLPSLQETLIRFYNGAAYRDCTVDLVFSYCYEGLNADSSPTLSCRFGSEWEVASGAAGGVKAQRSLERLAVSSDAVRCGHAGPRLGRRISSLVACLSCAPAAALRVATRTIPSLAGGKSDARLR